MGSGYTDIDTYIKKNCGWQIDNSSVETVLQQDKVYLCAYAKKYNFFLQIDSYFQLYEQIIVCIEECFYNIKSYSNVS